MGNAPRQTRLWRSAATREESPSGDWGRRRTCWRYSAGSSTRSGGVIRKQERSCTRIRPEIRGRRSRVRVEASQPSIPKGLRQISFDFSSPLPRNLGTRPRNGGADERFHCSGAYLADARSCVFFLNRNPAPPHSLTCRRQQHLKEDTMGLGRGALLWLLGIPLPIVLLLILFWHH